MYTYIYIYTLPVTYTYTYSMYCLYNENQPRDKRRDGTADEIRGDCLGFFDSTVPAASWGPGWAVGGGEGDRLGGDVNWVGIYIGLGIHQDTVPKLNILYKANQNRTKQSPNILD